MVDRQSSPGGGVARTWWRRFERMGAWIGLAVLGFVCYAGWQHLSTLASAKSPETALATGTVERVTGSMDRIRVAPATVAEMGLRAELVRPAAGATPLRMSGQLMLDASRRVHVHTRFAGEVVEVGKFVPPVGEPSPEEPRQLRVGDRARQGQLLAVLWSREIGEKKSDLVDALSQLYLHESLLRNLKKLEGGGTVPQRLIVEAQRSYEADLILVSRLQRTLRSWRIHEDEIAEVEAEAKRLHALAVLGPDAERPDSEQQREMRGAASWAQFEVLSPIDGVLLEKNFAVGDIVTTDLDLFKIADLSRLGVMVNAYEEDLGRLSAIPLDRRDWTVRLQANPLIPPRTGRFEYIGDVIDPNQHTAIVKGWLSNEGEHLRVGQFVEATVEMKPDEGLVQVPVTAIIDDGPRTSLFVAKNDARTEWELRRVALVRRLPTVAWLRSEPNAKEAADGALPLKPSEAVLASGALELAEALATLPAQ